MAIAVQSTATQTLTNVASGGNMTITKPSGTVEGDLLVALLAVNTRDGEDHDFTLPAGWTEIMDIQYNNSNVQAAYKEAGGSEGASYAFQHVDNGSGGDGAYCSGAILRIDGHGDVNDIQASTNNDTTPFSFDNGLTPSFANSLLIMNIAGYDNDVGSGAATSYAIATDDITWNEVLDTAGDLDATYGAGNPSEVIQAVAYGTRAETTATGNTSVSLTDITNAVCSLIIIPPATNVTVNVSPLVLEAFLPDASVTGTANVTVTPLVLNATFPDATVTTQENTVWTLESGPGDAGWTNESLI